MKKTSEQNSETLNPKLPNPLREIFLQAAELDDPIARARYLEEACGADRPLRKRVEALLAAEAAAGPLGETESAVQATDEHAVGERIGRYKLRQKIGEGGCGIVYVAEQEEPVRRRVALKVIKLGMDTKAVVARFEAERQALALMDHPNIAKVLDAGATENGRPYFVMELVRGVKITDYCDKNKISTRQRLDLFIRICHAVQHAHQKGIIHRDLKPSNILVTLHDGVPVPKVIDFGIAKATEGRLTDKTLYTELHQFIGTPAYMSPEQAEMSGLDIDTRSDIYSLGVLLYELLTGRTPFDAKELLKSGLDEMRRRICEVEPPRPSTKLSTLTAADLDTVAKAHGTETLKLRMLLRGDLDWIVMKCLEKDRTRRYEAATGLALDIQRHLNNETVLARPPSAAYRFQKLVRRNKLAFAAAAAVAAALLFGIFATSWQATRATLAERAQKRLKEQEVVQRQKAESAQQRAEAAARDLRRNLYVSDMSVAWQALQDKQVGRARELVERYLHPKTSEEDLRGFEWRILWQRSQTNYDYSFDEHRARATCAVFSPDGLRLATASFDRTVIVWDVETKKRIKSFEGFEDFVDFRALAFSPNGRWLAAKGGKQLRVWRTDSWQQVAALTDVENNDNANNAVVFSSDSATLATRAPKDGEYGVSFWDTATWQRTDPFLRSTTHEPGRDYSLLGTILAYSNDGRFLAVSDWGDLQIRDAGQPANLITNFTRPLNRVLSVAWSDQYVAAGYRGGTVVLWQRETWEQQGLPKEVEGPLFLALAFSPDGSRLAAGSGHVIQVWDVEALVGSSNRAEASRPRITLRGHTGGINAVAFTRDGRTLASASDDGTVKLWKLDQNVDELMLDGSTDMVGFSSDGKVFAFLHKDGRLHLSDVQHQRDRSFDIPITTLSPAAVALAPSGQQIAVGLTNGDVELWQLSDPPVLAKTLTGIRDGNPICTVGYSPEPQAQHLVVVSRSGKEEYRYRLHSLHGNVPPVPLFAVSGSHWSGRYNFSFSGDGKLLALVGAERGVRLFNVSDGTSRWIGADSELEFFTSVAISRDGSMLAAGHNIRAMVWMWDVKSGRPRGSIATGARSLFGIAFGPDAQTLLTWEFGMGGVTRFWNVALRKEILAKESLRNMGRPDFSPNGNVWALRSRDARGAIELLTIPSLAEIDALARPAGANNSNAEEK